MSQEQEKFLENLLKDNLFFQNFYQEWLEDMEKEKEKEKEKEEAKEKNKEKEITKENKAKMEKKEKKEKKETILYYCPFCGEKIAGFYYHIDTYHEEKEKEILKKIIEHNKKAKKLENELKELMSAQKEIPNLVSNWPSIKSFNEYKKYPFF